MATAHFVTVSSTTAEVTDTEAVLELLEDYVLGEINLSFVGEENNKIDISGYDALSVLKADEHGDPYGHPVTEEFLKKLSEYIADGEELDIRTVGNTKLRGVSASRYIVSSGEVGYTNLDRPTESI